MENKIQKVEVTDIGWDAPKSIRQDLPTSLVFQIVADEGVEFDDVDDILNRGN